MSHRVRQFILHLDSPNRKRILSEIVMKAIISYLLSLVLEHRLSYSYKESAVLTIKASSLLQS